MKNGKIMAVWIVAAVCLTGCFGGQSAVKLPAGKSNVDKVLEERAAVTEDSSEAETVKMFDDMKERQNEIESAGQQAKEEQNQEKRTDGVDFDLTMMNRDMVFATVYQFMTDPNTYIGRTVKMSGSYYASYFETTKKYYHYVIIQDATACCSQGMEFIRDDGSHVYPGEYPPDGTEVEVTGVFETYQEEGDGNLYCRLRDASFTVVELN